MKQDLTFEGGRREVGVQLYTVLTFSRSRKQTPSNCFPTWTSVSYQSNLRYK